MLLTKEEITTLVLETASLSPAKKRKVGAVLYSPNLGVIATGFNYNPLFEACEDDAGVTLAEVMHAEITCLKNAGWQGPDKTIPICHKMVMYVSHQPCEHCKDAIIAAGVKHVKVVEEFMKFDGDKLRYDLVPPSATEALAEVLTFGARKYKPNNWRNVEDPARYIAALERHIAAYKNGEMYDQESNLHHLAHAMCNLAFLLELNYQPTNLGTAKVRNPNAN